MPFQVIQNGTTLEISATEDGDYPDFEDVRTEVIRRNEMVVIKELVISIEDVTYPVPEGLNKVLSGCQFNDLVDRQKIEEQTRVLTEKNQAEDAEFRRRTDEALARARDTGDWDAVPEAAMAAAASRVIVTTSISVANREIAEEIDVITYECVYGVHALRDAAAAFRDMVGGRSKTVEKAFGDARAVAMRGLREEAVRSSADAVVAVDLHYLDLWSGAGGVMIVVAASGTAVRLANRSDTASPVGR